SACPNHHFYRARLPRRAPFSCFLQWPIFRLLRGISLFLLTTKFRLNNLLRRNKSLIHKQVFRQFFSPTLILVQRASGNSFSPPLGASGCSGTLFAVTRSSAPAIGRQTVFQQPPHDWSGRLPRWPLFLPSLRELSAPLRSLCNAFSFLFSPSF